VDTAGDVVRIIDASCRLSNQERKP